MRYLVLLLVVVCLASCTAVSPCGLKRCGQEKDVSTILAGTEPSPGEDRANVPIAVRDNTWLLQVPAGHEGPIVLHYVEKPASVKALCGGKVRSRSYDKKTTTLTINPGPWKSDGIIAVTWDFPVWKKAVAGLVEKDKVECPATGGILFVGSSTVVGWKLDTFFPGLGAVNRGFGGSQFVDLIQYADQVIYPHAPKTLVIYSGDNDIGYNNTPEHVAANVQALVRKLRFHLPETRFIILSIKPSIARWALWDKMKLANSYIEKIASQDPNMQYVDISAALLGANGEPRPELFQEDGLHLNPAGYEAISAPLRGLLEEKKD